MKHVNLSSMKLISVLMGSALLAACSSNAGLQSALVSTQAGAPAATTAMSTAASTATTTTIAAPAVTYEKDDAYTDWKSENPSYIEWKETTAALQGSGALVENNKVTIMLPGVYVISGKLSDGQIIVDLQDKGTVKLVLNGADITSKTNSPIYVKNAQKAIISLPEGTRNTVTDGKTYAAAGSEDAPDAAIFSKDDLTINGTGALTVQANYKDGIAGKDELKITGGEIKIVSADDGLLGRDMVAVKAGSLTIEAAGDGIKSTNDTDAAKGFIALEGGTYDIKAGADGLQAQTTLYVAEGKYTLATGGGSANANAAASKEQSAKGLKAADIFIKGGTLRIDSADDAVHSNNTLTLAGGSLTAASGDDGLHADASILIQGGMTSIAKSYEGIESKLITFTGGETRVVSSDDGINVGGGNDGSSVNGRPGQNAFTASGDSKLEIYGGYIAVDSAGDGLDSNGSITMTDGTVVVSGPTEDMNGALDYNGEFQMTGGLLVAAGSRGMAEAPSETSGQYSVLMTYPQVQQAGTLVTLKDSKDSIIASYAPLKQFQTLVITAPQLVQDGSYTLYTGGTSGGKSTDGLYSEGSVQGAAETVAFTAAGPVTWLNESGVTTAAAGKMGPGVMGGGKNGGVKP